MSAIRQALWTTLHLPFHIALVLTVEGSGQWITWQRTIEAMRDATFSLESALAKAVNSGMGGEGIATELAVALNKTYETYTFSVKTVSTMNQQLALLPEFPDSYWESFSSRDFNNPTADDTAVVGILNTLLGSLMNAILNTYGLTTSSKVKAQAESQKVAFDAEEVTLNAVYDRLQMIVSSGPVPSPQPCPPPRNRS